MSPLHATILLTMALAAGCAQAADPAIDLLAGGRLEGWVAENAAPGSFTVVDGVLHIEGTDGWLRYSQPLDNYSVSMEFRFLTRLADSGVFVRVGTPVDFVRGWPGNSYQIQTRDSPEDDINAPITGDLMRHRVAADGPKTFEIERARALSRGLGEWNRYEITVRDDQLTVSLNGEPVLDAGNILNRNGGFGLQCEGGIVEYRNITLRVEN